MIIPLLPPGSPIDDVTAVGIAVGLEAVGLASSVTMIDITQPPEGWYPPPPRPRRRNSLPRLRLGR